MTILPPTLQRNYERPEASSSVMRGSQLTKVASCKRNLELDEEVDMKRCPKCRQLFAAAMKFCRFDGAQLLSEAVPLGDAPTILFSTTKINERFPWLVSDTPIRNEQRSNNDGESGQLS